MSHPKLLPSKLNLEYPFIHNCDVDIVGGPDCDKMYFNLSDIANAYDVSDLNDLIDDEDYVLFQISKKNKDTEPYLTYLGLVKYLINHQYDTVKRLIKNQLISCMGTYDEKIIKASKLLDTSPKAIDNIFSQYARTMPSVYLIKLGLVEQIRDTFGIKKSVSKDAIVYMYGTSDDLGNLFKKYNEYFEDLDCSIELELSAFIDLQYISKTESSLKRYFDLMKLNIEQTKPFEINDQLQKINLAVIPFDMIETVTIQYDLVMRSFAGHAAEFNHKLSMEENKRKILILQHQTEISKLKTKNNIELAELKASKDAEIAALKEQLAAQKIAMLEEKLSVKSSKSSKKK